MRYVRTCAHTKYFERYTVFSSMCIEQVFGLSENTLHQYFEISAFMCLFGFCGDNDGNLKILHVSVIPREPVEGEESPDRGLPGEGGVRKYLGATSP